MKFCVQEFPSLHLTIFCNHQTYFGKLSNKHLLANTRCHETGLIHYSTRNKYSHPLISGLEIELPYILAYKSRNFGLFSPNILSIRLICVSPIMMTKFVFFTLFWQFCLNASCWEHLMFFLEILDSFFYQNFINSTYTWVDLCASIYGRSPRLFKTKSWSNHVRLNPRRVRRNQSQTVVDMCKCVVYQLFYFRFRRLCPDFACETKRVTARRPSTKRTSLKSNRSHRKLFSWRKKRKRKRFKRFVCKAKLNYTFVFNLSGSSVVY